tara:strand:+ start:248 stop:1735 length:1488 start_codon:yes stop_codon:yes gene_type:complete
MAFTSLPITTADSALTGSQGVAAIDAAHELAATNFQGIKVDTPTGFTLPTVLSSLEIYKNGNDYSTNIRPIDLIDTSLITNVLHVNIETGDDANSGNTWQSAVKSIWRAIEISLAPALGISSRIFIKGGTYPVENSFLKNNARWDFKNIDLTFEAKYGRVLVGAFSENAWALEGGQTNVYVCTRADAVIAVNPSLPDSVQGYQSKCIPGHTQYTNVTSIAEVETLEGSLWVNGTSVYVHPHGSVKATDLNTRIYEHKEMIGGSNYGNIYMRNIDTEGGRLGAVYSASANISSGMLVTDSTSHRYCIGGSFATPQPLFKAFSIDNLTLLAHFNTDASYGSTDGFSVAGTATNQNCALLVVNSVSNNCGLLTQNTSTSNKPNSVNGFTAHNGKIAISIGGEYRGHAGAPIAIVHDNTTAWVLGATAGDSEGDQINGKAVLTGGASAADASCKLWLDSCSLLGCDRELTVNDNAEILLRNHTGSGHYLEQTGGLVTAY